MGNAEEIGCRHSSASEATEGLSEGKTASAESSVSGSYGSNIDAICDQSECVIDAEGASSSPLSRGPGSESDFRPGQDVDDGQAGEADRALKAQALHGHPITVSQCKFQAHIGR